MNKTLVKELSLQEMQSIDGGLWTELIIIGALLLYAQKAY